MQVRGVSHVGIRVSDMERSITWYRDVLGWEQLFDERLEGPEFDALVGVAGASGRACGGRIGDVRVELMSFAHVPPTRRGDGLGLSVLSVEVADVAAARDELSERDVRVLGPTVEFHGTKMFFIVDPDGQPVELVEYIPGGPAWGGAYA
jgi:catechol 2,3-dioxygenase-like lactoylglutathione lyase family enzyme